MPFSGSASLPPDRTTGDSPTGGVAADLNLLKLAIRELQNANLALYSEIVQKTPVNPRDALTITKGNQINASNTGYSSALLQGTLTVTGTSGSPVTSTFDSTYNGQTIRDREFHGSVNVTGQNITFKNCIFHGRNVTFNDACVLTNNATVVNAVFEDCTFVPDTPSIWVNGINGSDFTLRRCQIYNTVDGAGVFNTTKTQPYASNVVIEYTYIHDLAYFTPDSNHAGDNQTHNDGIQVQGGTGTIVRFSNVQGYYGTAGSSQPTPNTSPTPSGASFIGLSCMLWNTNVGATSGNDVHDNLFGGGYIPLNLTGGSSSMGSFLRNEFDGGSLIMAGAKPQTILTTSTQTSTTGDGTVNANTFSGGTYSGQEVLVRHNG